MFQENSIETCILSRGKQITGPGWMHETSARTWCSGKTWRERVGREVGGGLGMGKTCEPKAFSFQCMTEFTTKKKKKSFWKAPLDILTHLLSLKEVLGNSSFFPLEQRNSSINYKEHFEKYQLQKFTLFVSLKNESGVIKGY